MEEELKNRISLIMAKVEILKLKATNGGYDWSHVDKNTQEQLNNSLIEIDKLLTNQP